MGPPTQRIARTAGLRTEADPVVSAATRAEEQAGREGQGAVPGLYCDQDTAIDSR